MCIYIYTYTFNQFQFDESIQLDVSIQLSSTIHLNLTRGSAGFRTCGLQTRRIELNHRIELN